MTLEDIKQEVAVWEKSLDNTTLLAGGKPINDFLATKGTTVYVDENEDFFTNVIKKYKVGIVETKLEDEIYKWNLIGRYQGLPDLSSPNFFSQLKSIDYNNLIYGVTNSVISHLSEAAPDEYFKCFNLLFDNNIPIQSRIQEFHDTVLSIYRKIGVENLSHHHDERTMSTFLSFKYPDRFPLFKYTFYEKLCYYLKEKPAKKFFYYSDYILKLEKFITDYIKPDEELISLVNSFIPEPGYSDPNHLLLAQDILYQVLDKGLGEERKYWRIGTSDNDSNYWPDMKNNSYISIGWPDIGNLDEQEVGDVSAMKLLLKKSYYKNKKEASVLGKRAKEISNFYNKISVGDVIIAQDGQRILGVGMVESVYSHDVTCRFPHQRKVSWWSGEPKFKNSTGLRTTVAQLTSPSLIDQVNEYIKENDKTITIVNVKNTMKLRTQVLPLNQILYGPPGTGKTYQTINKALAIIEGKTEHEIGGEQRGELLRRFKDYKENGQIAFTTFHQSMSYEDFLEGIKPDIEEDKDGVRTVIYDVKDGIFKSLCNKAKVSSVKEEKQIVYEFDDAWNDLVTEVRASEDTMDDFILDILTPKKGLKVTEVTDQGNLRLTPISVVGLEYTVSYARAKKLQAAFPALSTVKNIDKEFRAVIGGSNSTAYWAVINNLNNKITKNQSAVKINSMVLKPHVLIIDEINRGNVSSIFGELITCIEDSKRLGNIEALEVTLPYSKTSFGVPNNVYVIGTMNTADRSVEALDTALRRRFSFTEMRPQPSLLETQVFNGISLAEVLDIINQRIEVLLDSDHQIGHSYLINLKDLDALASAFKNSIVPLLQEYFYLNEEKIFLVLGSGFVKPKPIVDDLHSLFPMASYTNVRLPQIKQGYEIVQVDEHTIIDALTMLMGNE